MDDSLNDQESDDYSNKYNYKNLDYFMESVCSKDTNIRLDVFARLEEHLKNENWMCDGGSLFGGCKFNLI